MSSSPMRVFVTGSAGFIGFHLTGVLLDEGHQVLGYDGMTDYYDPGLKAARLARLESRDGFSQITALLEDRAALDRAIDDFAPDMIVHLAAQGGVRYSLENPDAYVQANLIGSHHVIEAARRAGVAHLLMASTSSVYGANTRMPYAETDKTDTPMSLYAATKKANEAMAHASAHLWGVPTTMFRFFTVYGPWGRPDMALFKFVSAVLKDEPIEVYNSGEMYRDFTYVGDLVRGIRLLMDVPPQRPAPGAAIPEGDSLSPVAPFRVVNIGNGDKVRLSAFIAAIETALGREARQTLLPMQKGDVPATWASSQLLEALTGYRPQTDISAGVAAFVAWYRDFYEI